MKGRTVYYRLGALAAAVLIILAIVLALSSHKTNLLRFSPEASQTDISDAPGIIQIIPKIVRNGWPRIAFCPNPGESVCVSSSEGKTCTCNAVACYWGGFQCAIGGVCETRNGRTGCWNVPA